MPVAHLPPTPDPTPDHHPTRGIKRAAPTEPDSPSFGRSNKRLATTSIAKPNPVVEKPYTPHTPVSSISRDSIYCLNPKYAIVQGPNGPVKIYQDKLCSLELRRLAREITCQMDWEVAEDNIACNRPCVVYRRLVRRMLLEKADELETEEDDEESDSDVKEEEESHRDLEKAELESEVENAEEKPEFESELDSLDYEF